MRKNGVPFLFAAAIFTGSFLLFQIQPMIGKYLLPWFGGSPAVWLACLMFFQILLFCGYGYAHGLQKMSVRRQILLHATLLVLATTLGLALSLTGGSPILPPQEWRTAPGIEPVWNIFRLLTGSIGLAYLLLAANASLLQAWFHRVRPQRSPYVFYVVSNAAALAALLSYPFLVEPHLALRRQAWIWYAGLGAYLLLCVSCAAVVWRKTPIGPQHDAPQSLPTGRARWRGNVALWILLSFCGVLALMSVTNRMTQDLPPVPFLWILPLSTYLLSYILGFSDKLRKGQGFYVFLLIGAFALFLNLAHQGLDAPMRTQIASQSFILLAVCLFCHNALYRLRPTPRHLTGFYLCIALGGALGGAFTALAAPLLFKGYWEYEIMLLLAGGLASFFAFSDPQTRKICNPLHYAFPLLWIGLALSMAYGIRKELKSTVYMQRNFFGSIRVKMEMNNQIPIYSMLHGQINHGMQIHHPLFRRRPTTYFGKKSGVGLAILNHRKRINAVPMHVGFVGMGVGVLAAYGRPGDRYRFYEIDPDVARIAWDSPWFSFLADSQADCETILGDARISLESELREGSRNYDLLVVDVFSGDHIPVHIITLEAFALYLQHLAQDGTIAVNISNRYLDLLPVLTQAARHFRLHAAYVRSAGDQRISANAAWVLLSRDPVLIRHPHIAQADTLPQLAVKRIRAWTDDFSSLIDVMR
jgi:hypothetical protein